MEYGIHKEETKEGFIGESKALDIEKINAETEGEASIENVIEEIEGVEEAPLEEVTAGEELAPEEIIEG